MTDPDVLVQVAREDRDPGVRRLAIKRVSDASQLRDIARTDPDPSLQELAAERAAQRDIAEAAEAPSGDVAATALSRLSDPDHLAQVATHADSTEVAAAAVARIDEARCLGDVANQAPDREVRLQAVERLDDPGVLARVVIKDDDDAVARAALARISDPTVLKELAGKVKRKALRHQLSDALAPHGGLPGQSGKKHRARRVRLLAEAESLLGARPSDHEGETVARLRKRWNKIPGPVPSDLGDRFETALRELDQRNRPRPSDEPTQPDPPPAAPADPGPGSAPEARDESPVPEPPSTAEEPAVQEPVAQDPAAPEAADPEPASAEPTAKEPADAPSAPTEAEPAPSSEEAPAPNVSPIDQAMAQEIVLKLEDLVKAEAPPDRKATGKLLRRFRELGVQDPELHDRLAKIKAGLAERDKERKELRRQQEQENLTQSEALCDRLEKLKQSDRLGPVLGGLKEGQAWLRKSGPLPSDRVKELRKRMKDVHQALHMRAQELREAEDWERFTNEPKLEALTVECEALVESDDPRKASRELTRLRKEWQSLGGDRPGGGRALQKRFNAAARAVKARGDEHFKKLDEERKQNLTLKKALCEEAEALSESTDFEGTARQLQEIQARWKEIGPVPRKEADRIWKRFRGACDPFFARRKEHHDQLDEERKQNLAKKEQLCQAAESLSEVDDQKQAEERAKKLQADWKTIGPVPRNARDSVWKRFRGACDAVFDREARQAQKEREEAIRLRGAILEELTQIIANEGEAPDDLVATVQDLRKRWRAAPARGSAEQSNAWQAALAQLLERHAESFAGTDLDVARSEKQRRELCEKIRRLEPPEETSVGSSATLDEMVAQLRDALTHDNRDRRTPEEHWRDLRKELDKLRDAWDRVGPVPGDAGQQVADEYEAACQDFEKRRKEALGRSR